MCANTRSLGCMNGVCFLGRCNHRVKTELSDGPIVEWQTFPTLCMHYNCQNMFARQTMSSPIHTVAGRKVWRRWIVQMNFMTLFLLRRRTLYIPDLTALMSSVLMPQVCGRRFRQWSRKNGGLLSGNTGTSLWYPRTVSKHLTFNSSYLTCKRSYL